VSQKIQVSLAALSQPVFGYINGARPSKPPSGALAGQVAPGRLAYHTYGRQLDQMTLPPAPAKQGPPCGNRIPFSRISVLIFVVLFGIAMNLYPGWNLFDPDSVGHDFWRNFVCDLQSSELPDGRTNRTASLVMTSAVVILLLGALLPTWWCLEAGPRTVRICRTFAIATTMLLVATVGELVLRMPLSHNVLTLSAGTFGLGATGIVLATSWERAHRATRGVAVLFLLAGLTNFTTYSAVQLGATMTIVVPASQRIALIGLLAWIVLHERDHARRRTGQA
jgi:hypothetical protein